MNRKAHARPSDGALLKKQKELIAIGISVVNCESCGINMGGGPAVSARH